MKSNKMQTKMSERQRTAWRLRQRGWRMKRIGRVMGIDRTSVSKLLRRARLRAGLPVKPRRGRSKWRVVRPISLSNTFNA